MAGGEDEDDDLPPQVAQAMGLARAVGQGDAGEEAVRLLEALQDAVDGHDLQVVLVRPWVPRLLRRPLSRAVDAAERLLAQRLSGVVGVVEAQQGKQVTVRVDGRLPVVVDSEAESSRRARMEASSSASSRHSMPTTPCAAAGRISFSFCWVFSLSSGISIPRSCMVWTALRKKRLGMAVKYSLAA